MLIHFKTNALRLIVGLLIALICHDLMSIPWNYFLVTDFIKEWLLHFFHDQGVIVFLLKAFSLLASLWMLGHLARLVYTWLEQWTGNKVVNSQVNRIKHIICSGLFIILVISLIVLYSVLIMKYNASNPNTYIVFILNAFLTAPSFSWVVLKLNKGNHQSDSGLKKVLFFSKVGVALLVWAVLCFITTLIFCILASDGFDLRYGIMLRV